MSAADGVYDALSAPVMAAKPESGRAERNHRHTGAGTVNGSSASSSVAVNTASTGGGLAENDTVPGSPT